jgi:acyl carrier protein
MGTEGRIQAQDRVDGFERLIRRVFELDEELFLSEDLGPGDVPGWDSLGTIALFAEIERVYNIALMLEEAASVDSIRDLRQILEAKGIQLSGSDHQSSSGNGFDAPGNQALPTEPCEASRRLLREERDRR